MKKKPFFVYTISDPDGTIRYVSITTMNAVTKVKHLKNEIRVGMQSPKAQWLREIKHFRYQEVFECATYLIAIHEAWKLAQEHKETLLGNKYKRIPRPKHNGRHPVTIGQYTTDDQLVAIYKSIAEAADHNHIPRTTLYNAVKDDKTLGGYKWRRI